MIIKDDLNAEDDLPIRKCEYVHLTLEDATRFLSEKYSNRDYPILVEAGAVSLNNQYIPLKIKWYDKLVSSWSDDTLFTARPLDVVLECGLGQRVLTEHNYFPWKAYRIDAPLFLDHFKYYIDETKFQKIYNGAVPALAVTQLAKDWFDPNIEYLLEDNPTMLFVVLLKKE